MNIEINTEKFNEALHHITRTIKILQNIRDEFIDSIREEKNNLSENKNGQSNNN